MKRELLAVHTGTDAQKCNSVTRHVGEALTAHLAPIRGVLG